MEHDKNQAVKSLDAVSTETALQPVDQESVESKLIGAKEEAKRLLERAANDCGAPFEPESVETLAFLNKHDQAEFTRIRAGLKVNKDISVVNLDKAIKATATKNEDLAHTHHGYATDMMKRLTVDGYRPVAYKDGLLVLDPETNIWGVLSFEALTLRVAEAYDGRENCIRSTDYSGIASHVIMIATDDSFFTNVPVGLACSDGFHHLKESQICVEALTPSHRQRVMIDMAPEKQETPMFDAFLHDTFKS